MDIFTKGKKMFEQESPPNKERPSSWLRLTKDKLAMLLTLISAKDQLLGALSVFGLKEKVTITTKQAKVIMKYAWLLYQAKISANLGGQKGYRNWLYGYLCDDNDDVIRVDVMSSRGRVDILIEDTLIWDINYALQPEHVESVLSRVRGLSERWMVWILLFKTSEVVREELDRKIEDSSQKTRLLPLRWSRSCDD